MSSRRYRSSSQNYRAGSENHHLAPSGALAIVPDGSDGAPVHRLARYMRTSRLTAIAVHPSLAEKLSLSAGQQVIARQGDSQMTLPLRMDDRLSA